MYQGVNDLPGAAAVAEALVDYKLNKGSEDLGKKSKDKKDRVDHETKSKKKHENYKPKANFSKPRKDPKTLGCFFCDRPNLAKNCLEKVRLNVVVAEEGSKEDGPTRFAPLQIVIAVKSVDNVESRSLIYVLFFVNVKKFFALVDTEATHTFVSKGVSKILGLKVAS